MRPGSPGSLPNKLYKTLVSNCAGSLIGDTTSATTQDTGGKPMPDPTARRGICMNRNDKRPGFRRALPIAIGISVALGGCANIQIAQDRNKARILSEGLQDNVAAGPIAARILPYALLSGVARNPALNRKVLKRGAKPPHFKLDCKPAGQETCRDTRYLERRANRLLRRYTLVADIRGPLDCDTKKRSFCPVSVNGLGIQVWRKAHRRGRCGEVVIVFRGTDSGSLGDWLTNLHWITRILPIHDQYEQVQDHIAHILDKARGCVGKRARIIAVGHSLGGGLAQHSAYVDPRIKQVIVFNPSFVTASSDRHANYEQNRFGLTIERIYEHDEILAYPRLLQRQFFPPTRCNPRIVHVRFSMLKGNFIFQHSMHELNVGLLRTARGFKPERRSIAHQKCRSLTQ